MWNGGSTKLQVTKGYWTTIGAKLLSIVGETFYSISQRQRQLSMPSSSDLWGISRASVNGGVPIASPMIKLVTRMEKIEKKAYVVKIAYLFFVGSFYFIFEFPFHSWKDNLVISVIKYFFPYGGLILPY